MVEQTRHAFSSFGVMEGRLNAEIRGISGEVGRELVAAAMSQDARAARTALGAGANPD